MRLAVEGLTVRFGRRTAVSGLNLSLPERGRVGLVGVNGAGKSTLLRAMAGAQRPAAGIVRYGEDALYARRSHARALSRVALMPQHVELPPGLTARSLVTYLTWLRGIRRHEAARRAGRALSQVQLDGEADSRLSTLSGGMLRRVALAQALAAEPAVLLLDEPSTGLDPQQRRVMIDVLDGLDESLVLMSSHVMEDISAVVDHIIVLHDGCQVFNGPLSELASHAPDGAKNSLEAAFLATIGAAR